MFSMFCFVNVIVYVLFCIFRNAALNHRPVLQSRQTTGIILESTAYFVFVFFFFIQARVWVGYYIFTEYY